MRNKIFPTILICLFINACQTPSTKRHNNDIKEVLANTGYTWRSDKRCYAKSTDWGTYCLKISDDRTIEQNGRLYQYLYFEGIPLMVVEKITNDTPIPRAFSLTILEKQADGSWQSLSQNPTLYTTSAPARIANEQFINLGKNHNGYIQRLFFADGQNIFREKTLISYFSGKNFQYTLADTGMNDAYRKQLNGTDCDKKSDKYQEEYCRNQVTIVGSAIGYHSLNESDVQRDEFYPLTIDCKGTRLGHPIDCSYQLVYNQETQRYQPNNKLAPWLTNSFPQ